MTEKIENILKVISIIITVSKVIIKHLPKKKASHDIAIYILIQLETIITENRTKIVSEIAEIIESYNKQAMTEQLPY